MLNFLQQKNIRQIIFEYLLRVTVYFLLFTLISCVILTTLFIPSFFFVKYKNDTINNQLLEIKQKNINVGEDPVSLIKNVNRLANALFDAATSSVKYSDIIDKITILKNKDIKILSIVITEENNTGVKKILINGTANTRDGLTLFEKDIRIDGLFKSVVFPVSNYIKSSDSEFSATLIL